MVRAKLHKIEHVHGVRAWGSLYGKGMGLGGPHMTCD